MTSNDQTKVTTMDVRQFKVDIFVRSDGTFLATFDEELIAADSLAALRSKLLDRSKKQKLRIAVPFDQLVLKAGTEDRWHDVKPGLAPIWKWRHGVVVTQEPRNGHPLAVYDDPAVRGSKRYGKEQLEELGNYGRFEDDPDDWTGHDEHVFAPMAESERKELLAMFAERTAVEVRITAFMKAHAIDLQGEIAAAVAAIPDAERPDTSAPRDRRRLR